MVEVEVEVEEEEEAEAERVEIKFLAGWWKAVGGSDGG